MMSRRLTTILLTLLVSAAAFTGSAAAETSLTSTLGTDNAVYTVREGLASELFPQDGNDNRGVLALDVTMPDGTFNRLRVPGTEGDEVEANTSIFFDASRDAVYLVWESSYQAFSGYSRLFLASYGPEGWSIPLQLSVSGFVEKSSMQLSMTRDQLPVQDENGGVLSHRRTMLHLVWIEDDGDVDKVVYCPIVLLDGEYERLGEPLPVGELAPGPQSVAEGGHSLEDSVLSVHSGADIGSVVIVAGTRGTSHLSAWELRVLPGEVSFVAQALHDSMLASASEGSALTPTVLERLESEAIALLDATAEHLSPSFRTLAKVEISDLFLDEHANVSSLAEEGRQRLVELGGNLDANGVRSIKDILRPGWIPLGARGGTSGDPQQDVKHHHVSLRLVDESPVPQIMVDRPTQLLNSRQGSGFVAYWQGEDRLHYQESHAEGWSETSLIALEGEVEAEDAVRLLQERLDNR